MKHPIDPKVDCVFKAILGAEQNKNLLIHFFNAMLFDHLQRRIADVELLNPYNEKEVAYHQYQARTKLFVRTGQ